MNKIVSVVALSGVLIAGAFYLMGATSTVAADKASKSAVSTDMTTTKAAILKQIQTIDPSIAEISLEQSPVDGVFWVTMSNGSVLLISADGRYILGNNLSEFKNGKIALVQSQGQKLANAESEAFATTVFSQRSNEGLVVYPAQGKKKGEVFVFTDVNCGYCRKFHKDVPALTAAGIEVKYFAGPFYSKKREVLEEIWCSPDPTLAMTEVKNGKKLSGVTVTDQCRDIVSQHIAIGEKLAIRGTPAIFSVTGEKLGGYVPPANLIQMVAK